jgi:hypothetical protein
MLPAATDPPKCGSVALNGIARWRLCCWLGRRERSPAWSSTRVQTSYLLPTTSAPESTARLLRPARARTPGTVPVPLRRTRRLLMLRTRYLPTARPRSRYLRTVLLRPRRLRPQRRQRRPPPQLRLPPLRLTLRSPLAPLIPLRPLIPSPLPPPLARIRLLLLSPSIRFLLLSLSAPTRRLPRLPSLPALRLPLLLLVRVRRLRMRLGWVFMMVSRVRRVSRRRRRGWVRRVQLSTRRTSSMRRTGRISAARGSCRTGRGARSR